MPWQPDYVDDTELAAFVRAAADDTYVAGYGTAASRAIDDACNRQFGQLDVAAQFLYPERFAVWMPDLCRWLVFIDDVQDTTGAAVTVDGDALAEGDDGWQWWPLNAVAKGGAYTGLTLADRPTGQLGLTVKFGWTAFPPAVVAATRLQVNRWHIRRESPYGIAGSPQEGSEMRLTARLDPDVRSMIKPLIRARMPR